MTRDTTISTWLIENLKIPEAIVLYWEKKYGLDDIITTEDDSSFFVLCLPQESKSFVLANNFGDKAKYRFEGKWIEEGQMLVHLKLLSFL